MMMGYMDGVIHIMNDDDHHHYGLTNETATKLFLFCCAQSSTPFYDGYGSVLVLILLRLVPLPLYSETTKYMEMMILN